MEIKVKFNRTMPCRHSGAIGV